MTGVYWPVTTPTLAANEGVYHGHTSGLWTYHPPDHLSLAKKKLESSTIPQRAIKVMAITITKFRDGPAIVV